MADTLSDPSIGCPSRTIWIVLFIVFLLVGIGLGAWIIYLYVTGRICSPENNVMSLGNPRITANLDTITGAWGTLTRETDRVTLYVSEKPFKYNDNGQVIVNQSSVQSAFAGGSNNSVTITVGNSRSRYAMLVVTRENSIAIRVFGPVRVYTQVEANLTNSLFTITDLNTGNGGVSNTGNYAVQTPARTGNGTIIGTNNYGIFRRGLHSNTNSASNNFLVRYLQIQPENGTEVTSPVEVLCRTPTTGQVGLKVWANSTSSTVEPIICPAGTTGTDCPGLTIPIDQCQWSYNAEPTQANGQNKWCLTASQANVNNMTGTREPVCLSQDGQSLVLTSVEESSQWINLLTGTQSPPQ
jgi:hypothetical protein